MDVVDLGDGWFRLAEPGEELFRVQLDCLERPTPWMEESRLAELQLWNDDTYALVDGKPRYFPLKVAAIESMVVPGAAPVADEEPGIACRCEWPAGCGGLGQLDCMGCGGDLCVCVCGGFRECAGCELCEAPEADPRQLELPISEEP